MFSIAIIILLIIEVLSFIALKEHYFKTSKPKFYFLITLHLTLSLWLWISLIRVMVYRDHFDNPVNVSNQMTLAGMIAGVVFPRIVLSFFHFTGKLLRICRGGYIRWLTITGILFSALIFIIVANGTLIGRFNFKTEEVTVRFKDLDKALDGIKIVQLSDLHLSSFYRKMDRLEGVMNKINTIQPDIIVNTGDFITYGWREFDRCDTILSKSKSIYSNFAVFGNHDRGTYLPDSGEEDMEDVMMKMIELITNSGYRVLNDEHTTINIKGAEVAIIGVTTGGSHPDIIHGDLDKAAKGTDSVDFKILLCHDPNQWDEDVTGKTDIDLTLAGHTHGMQMGIITKKIRWSPAKRFYKHWNGLYSEGDQFLYVNRGLGVLAVPFRIWMPPEITVITLKAV